MTTPTKVDVNDDTRDMLGALAQGDPTCWPRAWRCGPNSRPAAASTTAAYALVKLAALIALDAPPASYIWQVANALAEGATPEDILGVLIAIAPQVGGPRLVAAAPEIMVALGLTLPDGM